MLRIRNEQMMIFEAERRRLFEERAVRYLRELPSASGEPEAALRRVVGGAWDKGERHGLRNEHDVLQLVGICHIFGVDFDAHPDRPWAREVLDHPRMSAASKMRVLWARLREEA